MKTSATVPSLSSMTAEGDKLYSWAIYNDTSGALSLGIPLYIDTSDAGEWNVQFGGSTGTALASGSVNYKIQTAGKVVLSTNIAASGSPCCVGTYAPEQGFGYKPQKGEKIRILTWGRGVVSVAVKGSGGQVISVGGRLIVSTTGAATTSAIQGSATTALNIGTVLATSSYLTYNTTVVAAPGGTNIAVAYVNAFVNPS
jgi:hypothetical protein